MKLVNLQLPSNRSEKELTIPSEPSVDSGPRWPWEMKITLNKETIDKLGLNTTSVKAGESFLVNAKAFVCDVNSNERIEDGKTVEHNRIELQITDIGIVSQDNFEEAFDEAIDK